MNSIRKAEKKYCMGVPTGQNRQAKYKYPSFQVFVLYRSPYNCTTFNIVCHHWRHHYNGMPYAGLPAYGVPFV